MKSAPWIPGSVEALKRTRWILPLTGGRLLAWDDKSIVFEAPAESYTFKPKIRDAIWAAATVESWAAVEEIAFRYLPRRFKRRPGNSAAWRAIYKIVDRSYDPVVD